MSNSRNAVVIPEQQIGGLWPILKGKIIRDEQKDVFGVPYDVFYENGDDSPILHYREVILAANGEVPNGKNWNRSEKYGIFYFK